MTPETNARVAALADEFVHCCAGDAAARFADRFESLAEFPPPEEVVAQLASAITSVAGACTIPADARLRVSWALFELLNGGYLGRKAIDRRLMALEHDLARSRCDLEDIGSVLRAGRRAARESRYARTDWW